MEFETVAGQKIRLNPYCIGTVIERLFKDFKRGESARLNPYCIGTVIERRLSS